jgi:hypothetical protein
MTRSYNHPDAIKTLEDIRSRCWIDEDTGCWVWRLASDKDGQGKCSFKMPGGKKTQTTARRVAWILSTGKPIPAGKIIYYIQCRNPLCVNPAHMTCGTKAEAGKHLHDQGYLRGHPARIAKNTRLVHQNIAKLDWAKVREIRSSNESRYELAERFGVKPNTVRDVQNHRCWREIANSSVFAYRP